MESTKDMSRYVEQWKQCIASSELEFQSAKEHLAKVRTEFRSAVASFVETEQAKPLLNALYWDTDFPVKDLAKSCGLANDRAFNAQFVTPITMTVTCSKCRMSYETEVRTRTRRTELLSKKDSYTCGTCLATAEAELADRQNEIYSFWARRKKTVELLKKMPYSEYLQTDHWNHVRLQALKSARYRCQLCNQAGKLHVHHRHYETLGEEEGRDVIALCSECHAKFHDKLA